MKSNFNHCGRFAMVCSVALFFSVVIAATGCKEDEGTGPGPEVCMPENGPFTLEIDNPYMPFVVGSFHVMEGQEAGEHFTHTETEVLDETQDVGGVTTRVVRKVSWDDHLLVGDERLFFAQAPDGTVCLFGEEEEVYENDVIVEVDGWLMGEDGAYAGIFMPGDPQVGDIFEMYHDAEEIETGEITEIGVSVVTPAGTFDDTLAVLEDGPSVKKYARDVGEIYDDGIELVQY